MPERSTLWSDKTFVWTLSLSKHYIKAPRLRKCSLNRRKSCRILEHPPFSSSLFIAVTAQIRGRDKHLFCWAVEHSGNGELTQTICSKGTGRKLCPEISKTETERSDLPLKWYFIVARQKRCRALKPPYVRSQVPLTGRFPFPPTSTCSPTVKQDGLRSPGAPEVPGFMWHMFVCGDCDFVFGNTGMRTTRFKMTLCFYNDVSLRNTKNQ